MSTRGREVVPLPEGKRVVQIETNVGVSSSSAEYFPLSFIPLTLMRDALLSMTEVLPRRGSRSVDTRLTASTVGIEVAFSSLSVGVHAQGECRFERTVISEGGGASVGVGTLGLPNLRKGLP